MSVYRRSTFGYIKEILLSTTHEYTYIFKVMKMNKTKNGSKPIGKIRQIMI